jgi:alpha-mannosidase
MESLPDSSTRKASIIHSLYNAFLSTSNYEDVSNALKITACELEKNCGDECFSISAVGHAHIDLAWLWPIRETKRKGIRTFATALKNMDKYSDYIFGASQPQLYQWIKEAEPALYEKIKEQIKAGRWEVQGGMWVEPDTNLPGGESLVRQLLYGKKFFQDEFSIDVKSLWLPDVFGYSGALPQLLKKAGIKYFMTTKLSWNEFNQFPYHTFTWKGIDGTEVLVHLPPNDTYNSPANPQHILRSKEQYLEKGMGQNALMLFGIGDGGGGPGEEHLERLQREKHLSGLVPVKQEHSAQFFEKLDNGTNYPVWNGELYFEKHIGTYTTQAKNKMRNRQLEFTLRNTELLCSLAMVWQKEYCYPQSELESLWKEVLLYQFHDILPGSSIKRVYDESLQRYECINQNLEQRISHLLCGEPEQSNSYAVFNSLGWEVSEWRKLNDCWVFVKAKPLSVSTIKMNPEKPDFSQVKASDFNLENDVVSVKFNIDGSIAGVFDKTLQREALSGSGNVLSITADDIGADAWDFSPIIFDRKREGLELKQQHFYSDGPKAIAEFVWEYNLSTIKQCISITLGSKRVNIETEANWKESKKMLRASFPINIHTKEATCDIQFGSIKRPTHSNTSWDAAQYEVCAHKYVDLSQYNCGVALLNNCKYGHRIKDNTIDIDLLRSTNYPGANADQGIHRFAYAILPHTGGSSEVIRDAYEFNIPLLIKATSATRVPFAGRSLLYCENKNVIIETVKKAEADGSIIVRLFEAFGSDGTVRMHFGFDVKSVQVVNLLEQELEQEEVAYQNNTCDFFIKPFEVVTLKVMR